MLQQFLVFISLGKTSKKRLALRKKEKDIKPQDCLWTEELPGPGSGPSFPKNPRTAGGENAEHRQQQSWSNSRFSPASCAHTTRENLGVWGVLMKTGVCRDRRKAVPPAEERTGHKRPGGPKNHKKQPSMRGQW